VPQVAFVGAQQRFWLEADWHIVRDPVAVQSLALAHPQ
jgi:hypothetical protein